MQQKYPLYKPSGVEWIGEVPESWEIKRLRSLCWLNPSKRVFSETELHTDTVFLPMERVSEKGEFNQDLRKPVKDLLSGYTYFERGDVIIAKITPCFENGKGAFLDKLVTPFGFGSTEFHVLRSKADVAPKFIYYVTKADRFMNVGEAFMTGAAGQKRVPTEFLMDYVVPTPSYKEQQAIATYLDEKTALIDDTVRKKQRLIELLQEERTALINQAVTRGLNPNVPMKPSGVEWLGEIPAHWEVLRLRYLLNYTKGYAFKSHMFTTEGIPVVKASDIKSLTIKKGKDYLPENFKCSYPNIVLSEGDIIMSTVGSTPDVVNSAVGQIAKVPKELGGALLNQNTVRLENMFKEKVSEDFLFLLLQTKSFRNYLDVFAHGTANQASLTIEDVLNFTAFLPPYSEQLFIVQKVNEHLRQTEDTCKVQNSEIALLQEYRTALINEVVTGKRCVVPQPEALANA